jgi:energy-coupling factor transport system ATP-binding protein
MNKPVIEFKDFTFKYYTQKEATLHNINLSISKGEKILIVGPSGCGKSTLASCINGLIPHAFNGVSTGSLTINNKLIKDTSIFDLSKEIGSVLQDTDGQFVGLTTAEDIAFALENDCCKQDEMLTKVDRVAKLVDMQDFMNSNPQQLSGGQKQRVSLAGVMVDDVDILLFDEPLANLDPKTGQTAIKLIDDIHKLNKTIVIIEHRLEDVLYRDVDRIIVMSQGKIVMDDTPDIVLSSDILIKNGIREPLYVQASKYANIEIEPKMLPASISTFNLMEKKEKLIQWHKDNAFEEIETENEIILECKNLSFSYIIDKPILTDINFKVYKGEMLAIVGENGAGKSTLSKLIVGFEKQDEGQIFIDNKDISDLSIKERADYVGIVLQNPNHMISENLIYDEIALGLRIRKIDEKDIEERVFKVMKTCGLEKFKKWPISALSYGQKKRVTIASILVLNPQILILDEPTAGQDYKHYSDIMEFLQELNKLGITIIMITHDMHLMLEYTKRAIVISNNIKLADDYAYKILFNEDIIEKANLKKTSLYTLAINIGVDPDSFISTFIKYERKVRNNEN